MDMKPAFAQATAVRGREERYKMANTMLALPDTSMTDHIEAEQAAERLRDGYAEYFARYDALVTHVLPILAHKHGVEEFVIDGKTVDATYVQGVTVPLNLTGLPGVAMRFGTSSEGLPINIADRSRVARGIHHSLSCYAAGRREYCARASSGDLTACSCPQADASRRVRVTCIRDAIEGGTNAISPRHWAANVMKTQGEAGRGRICPR